MSDQPNKRKIFQLYVSFSYHHSATFSTLKFKALLQAKLTDRYPTIQVPDRATKSHPTYLLMNYYTRIKEAEASTRTHFERNPQLIDLRPEVYEHLCNSSKIVKELFLSLLPKN